MAKRAMTPRKESLQGRTVLRNDESSWFIIINHDHSSRWIIMMDHHDSQCWFIHDESSGCVMTPHDESSWWFRMMKHPFTVVMALFAWVSWHFPKAALCHCRLFATTPIAFPTPFCGGSPFQAIETFKMGWCNSQLTKQKDRLLSLAYLGKFVVVGKLLP